jgi:ubiquinol-cytochrome c reductase iron-sulfur subunit
MATPSIQYDSDTDLSRRKFLTRATIAVGAVGVLFTAVPFVESWLPSEQARAQGGPVKVDVSKIDPGAMIVVIWRRKPMYIVHRTPEMLSLLGNHDNDLKDPKSLDSTQPSYCKNTQRSRRADLFVTIGICTHLGCLPKARFTPGEPDLGANWPGGWHCPCHGSRFDLAGRVFDGSPASVNLVIAPYSFQGAQTLVVGVDESGEASS